MAASEYTAGLRGSEADAGAGDGPFWRRKRLALLLSSSLVASISGCADYDTTMIDAVETVRYEIDAVRAMEPQGPAFNQGLREGYLDYADLQSDSMDYAEYWHFAFKAVDSAKGETVLADRVDSRAIPAKSADALTIGRARLMGALEGGGRKKAPAAAARAQTAFDCWLERTEDDDSPAAIEACRGRFELAVIEVERALTQEDSQIHLVFFPWNQAQLTPVAHEVLNQMASTLRTAGAIRLTVAGHADSSGSDSYNDALSLRRARAVEQALIRRGFDGDQIELEWHGERRPRVRRPDDTREPENRRVEISPKG